MPFKSKKQEQYLRINEPEVYRDWKNKYGSYKNADTFGAECEACGTPRLREDDICEDCETCLGCCVREGFCAESFSADYRSHHAYICKACDKLHKDTRSAKNCCPNPDFVCKVCNKNHGNKRFARSDADQCCCKHDMGHEIEADDEHFWAICSECRFQSPQNPMPKPKWEAETFSAESPTDDEKEHSWVEVPKPEGYLHPHSNWRYGKHWECEWCKEIKHTNKAKPHKKGCSMGYVDWDTLWDAESFSADSYKEEKIARLEKLQDEYYDVCDWIEKRGAYQERDDSEGLLQGPSGQTREESNYKMKEILKRKIEILENEIWDAESFSAERTIQWSCDDCERTYANERDANECCYQGCPHVWSEDRVKNWEDGLFTIYVSCNNCGTNSYIEGHADEHSDSNPTPDFENTIPNYYKSESFSADSEATATLKSALYSLTAVGVGVFIFNKYVKDKLPNKRDE